ncbi:MAG TPA: 3-ketoacyl-ACP reductase [Pirellulales bacterium]|jgi:NAD(P)-dependent dehydrogenase (short-subunit alcohol dehydrogenase family)
MKESPVAIVTGASRGIGRAIALGLAQIGYAMVVNYATRKEAANAVVAEIERAGGRAAAAQADVTKGADRQRLVDGAVKLGGRLDLLVNNAGITSPGRRDLLEATEESWDLVFDTNLKGPFFLAQACARRMIELAGEGKITGGKIINVSSISAYALSTDRADYCLAKSAMPMMTWLLAARLAENGISVFEICPGVIATDMTAPVKELYDEQIAAGLAPMRRWGEPEDVARAVTAIASGAFPFSTGERINVDGGFHIRRL